MFCYTGDPEGDFERYSASQEALLLRLPVCTCCAEHIQQEMAVRIDGRWYCDGCLEDKKEFVDSD